MANYTATTDMTLETAITNGSMVNGENLTINSGAVVTCDETNSVLIGAININDGKFLVTQPVTGNVTNFVGDFSEEINSNGQGVFETTGGWYDIGTTDGTNDQVITVGGAATYFGTDFVDVIPALWIETGRRLNFTSATGTAPEIDDWVYVAGNKDAAGMIVEVQATYLVVKFLVEPVANLDALTVRKIVDNFGPDFQETWAATANGADVKEAGVYQAFGNAVWDEGSKIGDFGFKMGGFVFAHIFQANTLVLGGAGGGFVPPTGCNIRVPNIHFSQSNTTNFPLGTTYNDASNFELSRYNLTTTNAGEVILSVCNVGSPFFGCISASVFTADYVGATLEMGSSVCGSKSTFNECVVTSDPLAAAVDQRQAFRAIDLSSGSEVTNCLVVHCGTSRLSIGAQNCIGVTIKNCIQIYDTVSTGSGGYGYYFAVCSDIIFDNCVAFNRGTDGTTYPLFLTTVTNFVGSRFKLAYRADETSIGTEIPSLQFNVGTSNVLFSGFEILGVGTQGDKFISILDSRDIKLRCFGMIDEKINMGTSDSEDFINILGQCSDLDFARMWKTEGGVQEFIAIPVSSKNVNVTNCSGLYASELVPQGGDSISFKGIHGASGNYGNNNNGVECDYPATYGSHMHDCFRSDTTGGIFIVFSPKTAATSAHYTVLAGAPKYFRDGDLDVLTGDIIEYEMQYFALGHTTFTGVLTTTSATNDTADGVDEWGSGNVQLEFQYDTGAGYNGSWLDLRTAGNLTGITDTTDGVKLKIKLTALADTINLNGLMVHTTTTLAAQSANLHPIDQNEVTISVKCIDANAAPIQNARVRLTKTIGGAEILSGLTNVNGIVEDTTYIYTADEDVEGWTRKSTSAPYYVQGPLSGTISSAGLSLTTTMIDDE